MNLALLFSLILTMSAQAKTGFLVIAPDRGFLGNEESRDAFTAYAPGYDAAFAVVGRDNDEDLGAALAELTQNKVDEVVVLPLFASTGHPMHAKALDLLAAADTSAKLYLERPYGEHPLALAAFKKKLAQAGGPRDFLLLLAHGSEVSEDNAAVEKSLHAAAGAASAGWGGHAVLTLLGAGIHDGPIGRPDMEGLSAKASAALASARKRGLRPVVAAYDFASKMDSMMTLAGSLAPALRGAEVLGDLTPNAEAVMWLKRVSNDRLPVVEGEFGMVYMPHGATHRWNTTLLEALGDLPQRTMLEPAFSMGDPSVIQRAVERLEKRGARKIAVVRVFSLASSFKEQIEAALGLAARPREEGEEEGLRDALNGGQEGQRPQSPTAQAPQTQRPDPHGAHAGHAGKPEAHGAHHGHGAEPEFIFSAASLLTVGGIEDAEEFADALADNAAEISENPADETVILVAHGTYADADNARWEKNLASLAARLREFAAGRGVEFKAVEWGTWREDWPQKKPQAVKRMRELVERASKNGRALVVAARTGYGGPEPELLKGLSFKYSGDGFAPHPAFARWVEGQKDEALERFRAERLAGLIPLN